MTGAIENYAPASGRVMREDSSVTNLVAPNVLLDGQNAAVTATAGAIASSTLCNVAFIQSDPSNTINILFGNSTSQNGVLTPGQWSPPIMVDNLNKIYVKTASAGTQKVNWTGSA